MCITLDLTYRDTSTGHLYQARCVQDACTLQGEETGTTHYLYREVLDDLINDGTLAEYTADTNSAA